MSLYAKLILWLIRPALEEERRQQRISPPLQVVINPPRYSSEELQEAVKRDIRGRFAKKPELHR